MITLRLTDEIREALKQRPDGVLSLEDDQSHTVYVLIPQGEYQRLVEEDLRRLLQPAFDEADRGDVAPWDPESIKAKGRAQLECEGSSAF